MHIVAFQHTLHILFLLLPFSLKSKESGALWGYKLLQSGELAECHNPFISGVLRDDSIKKSNVACLPSDSIVGIRK